MKCDCGFSCLIIILCLGLLLESNTYYLSIEICEKNIYIFQTMVVGVNNLVVNFLLLNYLQLNLNYGGEYMQSIFFCTIVINKYKNNFIYCFIALKSI